MNNMVECVVFYNDGAYHLKRVPVAQSKINSTDPVDFKLDPSCIVNLVMTQCSYVKAFIGGVEVEGFI